MMRCHEKIIINKQRASARYLVGAGQNACRGKHSDGCNERRALAARRVRQTINFCYREANICFYV